MPPQSRDPSILAAPPGTWSERFRVVSRLGSGGFAEVFAAIPLDGEDGDAVALKILQETIDPVAWDRFRKEVNALQTLDSPHIVAAFEADETMQWYTMPIAAQDLWKGAPELEPSEKFRVAESIAKALLAAHAKLLIHRDVSPGNVLHFPGDEEPWKLSDFGLVRRFPGHTTQIITSGPGIGTVYFAPPEAELDPHRMDHRADIFSLGQVIGWLVSGQKPRPQQTTILAGSPWSELVARMTSRPVNDRPQTMDEVVAALPPILKEIRVSNRRAWDAGAPRQSSIADRAVLQILRYVFTEGAVAEHRLLDEHQALGLTRLGARMAINSARGSGLLLEEKAENDHGEIWMVLRVTGDGVDAVRSSISEGDVFVRASSPQSLDDLPF